MLVLLMSGCQRPHQAAARDEVGEHGRRGGVQGQVVDPQGRPIADLFVKAEAVGRLGRAVPEKAVYTDENGEYWWALPPGKYRVTVAATGFRQASGEVTVWPGKPAILDFSLVPDDPVSRRQ